jgi:hypothetical protein
VGLPRGHHHDLTDELGSYKGLAEEYAGHETVKHSADEFARNLENGMKAHTKTAESYFSLMKRGHDGVYHRMSRRHLPRYCFEFNFHWNKRE